MSDELDDFLRQAAQRRQQRQQEKNKRATSTTPAPNTPQQRSPYPTPQAAPLPSSRPDQPAPRTSQRSERPPVVAVTVTPETRHPISDFQASIDNRHVESDLSFADERMAEHVKQALGSDLSQRSPLSGKKTNKQSGPRNLEPEKMSASAPTGSIQSTAMVSSLDLKQQLRDPQTLRLAIIAHEILRRPYP